MMMWGSRRRGLIAGLSIAAVVGVAVTDWPLGSLSTFWSEHAMLTNLVSSAVFAVITVTIIEWWLRSQEERHNDARRREEERRLTIVRLVAYNAVARAPIAQRRIMWFLVHGGELRPVPEFEISGQHVRELRATLARLGLSETSEHRVMLHGEERPSLSGRFRALAQDEQWRRLVHVVLLDVVHSFRLLVARWSALLLTTQESARALKDLAAQAEELSRVFVEFDAGKPASNYVGDELRKRQLLWSRAFANSVALEEALIDKGGERATVGERFRTPGRNLLLLADRRKLEGRDGEVPPSLRLHDVDSLTVQPYDL
ncbi:MAG: hypothetical protein ACRDRR_15090 [Pseudonocardiaceae bacterium]